MRRRLWVSPFVRFAWMVALGVFTWSPAQVHAQTEQGRLVDTENGAAVGLAGVFILNAEREVVVGAVSDTAGFYSIAAPDEGEYYLYEQRVGYFENETPLFRAEAGSTYSVDIQMRPEPFRIDPLSVTVENEELEDFLTLDLGENPNALFGYRAFQGSILQQAMLGARDNIEIPSCSITQRPRDERRRFRAAWNCGNAACAGSGGTSGDRGRPAR